MKAMKEAHDSYQLYKTHQTCKPLIRFRTKILFLFLSRVNMSTRLRISPSSSVKWSYQNIL